MNKQEKSIWNRLKNEYADNTEVLDVLCSGENARHKQIPKKPIYKTDYEAFASYYVCPTCGAMVIKSMYYCAGNKEYGEPSERGCGQALKWEE